MTFTKTTALALITSLSFTALPALASDDGMVSADVKAQITEKLTAEGYEVRQIEAEDGLYEAYALKDGKRLEIYFDAQLNIVKTKADD